MPAKPTGSDTWAPILAVGLMSGTSADGMDAAVLETDGETQIKPLAGMTLKYQPDFRARLIQAASQDVALHEILEIEDQLTRAHANAVVMACQSAGVSLDAVQIIGFHGHTIRHLPDRQLTWQMGNGQLLAQLTGCQVVYDFRKRDMAAGGQGAPLAPLYHQAIVSGRPGAHLVLNLGGVGNVTWVHGDQILAGDTGPGCGLLDAWMEDQTGQPLDRDGQLALTGTIDRAAVDASFRGTPFFAKPLPKSADRFEFDHVDVSHLSVADGAATLCAVTVEAVARSVEPLPAKPDFVWVTGGGRHHPLMMQLLRQQFTHVASIDELGHQGDFVEAGCFGWLAVRRLRGLFTSLPETTGASKPTCGGVLVGKSL